MFCAMMHWNRRPFYDITQVEYEEDGSGAGGYAKEMSEGWKEVRHR